MSSPRLRGSLLALLVTGGAAILAACTPAEPAGPTSPPTSSATAEPAPTDDAQPTPTADAAAPTCETLISASLVDELTALGWSAQEEDLMVGSVPLAGGIQCVWADFEGLSSDNVLLFGWAPVAASEAARLQADLLTQGWVREDGPDGIYLTVDPQYAVSVDEDGYGMTYLFGDGWMTVAGTKQGLVLIERPVR